MPVIKRFTVADLEATQRKQRNADSKIEVLLEQFTDTVNKSNELLASAQIQNVKNVDNTPIGTDTDNADQFKVLGEEGVAGDNIVTTKLSKTTKK